MADRGISDLLSTASSLLNSSQTHSSNASHGAPKPSSSEQGNAKPSSSSHSQKPSYGEVLSSAQMVMNAAKTKLHKPSSSSSSSSAEEVNMGKLAGAAGTLVGAVSHYGKLEETGYGKYAHKAQEYLHSYEIKHGKPGTTAPTPPPQAYAYHATSEQHGNGHGHSTYTSASAASYSQQPSAPPQGYPTYTSASAASYSQQPSAPPQGYSGGYPPAGYPDAQQSYGYGHQGYSKPTHSYANADNEPPIGYPPAGYPTSGGGYNRPSK